MTQERKITYRPAVNPSYCDAMAERYGWEHEDGDKALRWLLLRYEPQTLIKRFINERKRLFHNWFWFKAEPWINRFLIERFNLARVNDDLPF